MRSGRTDIFHSLKFGEDLFSISSSSLCPDSSNTAQLLIVIFAIVSSLYVALGFAMWRSDNEECSLIPRSSSRHPLFFYTSVSRKYCFLADGIRKVLRHLLQGFAYDFFALNVTVPRSFANSRSLFAATNKHIVLF